MPVPVPNPLADQPAPVNVSTDDSKLLDSTAADYDGDWMSTWKESGITAPVFVHGLNVTCGSTYQLKLTPVTGVYNLDNGEIQTLVSDTANSDGSLRTVVWNVNDKTITWRQTTDVEKKKLEWLARMDGDWTMTVPGGISTPVYVECGKFQMNGVGHVYKLELTHESDPVSCKGMGTVVSDIRSKELNGSNGSNGVRIVEWRTSKGQTITWKWTKELARDRLLVCANCYRSEKQLALRKYVSGYKGLKVFLEKNQLFQMSEDVYRHNTTGELFDVDSILQEGMYGAPSQNLQKGMYDFVYCPNGTCENTYYKNHKDDASHQLKLKKKREEREKVAEEEKKCKDTIYRNAEEENKRNDISRKYQQTGYHEYGENHGTRYMIVSSVLMVYHLVAFLASVAGFEGASSVKIPFGNWSDEAASTGNWHDVYDDRYPTYVPTSASCVDECGWLLVNSLIFLVPNILAGGMVLCKGKSALRQSAQVQKLVFFVMTLSGAVGYYISVRGPWNTFCPETTHVFASISAFLGFGPAAVVIGVIALFLVFCLMTKVSRCDQLLMFEV